MDRQHDMLIYAKSGVDGLLSFALQINGTKYIFYGDSGYTRREFLETSFEGRNLTVLESVFNTAMSKARMTVEWFFIEVNSYWSLVDCNTRLRVRQIPAGCIYQAAIL